MKKFIITCDTEWNFFGDAYIYIVNKEENG